jgi:hypothetical protein
VTATTTGRLRLERKERAEEMAMSALAGEWGQRAVSRVCVRREGEWRGGVAAKGVGAARWPVASGSRGG